MPDKIPVIVRAAIYARVSTDDQAERGTIQAQIHALRQTVPHWGMEIVGEYLDDGYSGTLALEERPEGLRLMEDAKALAREIAFWPPVAMQMSKRVLQYSTESYLEEQLLHERRGLIFSRRAPHDVQEAAASFRERRPPNFTGH